MLTNSQSNCQWHFKLTTGLSDWPLSYTDHWSSKPTNAISFWPHWPLVYQTDHSPPVFWPKPTITESMTQKSVTTPHNWRIVIMDINSDVQNKSIASITDIIWQWELGLMATCRFTDIDKYLHVKLCMQSLHTAGRFRIRRWNPSPENRMSNGKSLWFRSLIGPLSSLREHSLARQSMVQQRQTCLMLPLHLCYMHE